MNFRKNLEQPFKGYSAAWGKLINEKPENLMALLSQNSKRENLSKVC
jgi:hypothetical protein